MEITFDKLRKEMDELEYPPNHKFDVKTLLPLGNAINRIKMLDKFAPDLMGGGYSLLDVGCNKGLLSFYLRKKFNYIKAIDSNINFIQFGNKLVDKHKIKNITFLHYNFEQFVDDEKFDVLYFGQCTHYIFRNAIRNNQHPLEFLYKAKRLAKKIIAIDGAFTLKDPSVKFDSKQDNWTDNIKRYITIQSHCSFLWPEFELKSFNWGGNGATRSIAIFKRRFKDG